jgi:hypothetical protein
MSSAASEVPTVRLTLTIAQLQGEKSWRKGLHDDFELQLTRIGDDVTIRSVCSSLSPGLTQTSNSTSLPVAISKTPVHTIAADDEKKTIATTTEAKTCTPEKKKRTYAPKRRLWLCSCINQEPRCSLRIKCKCVQPVFRFTDEAECTNVHIKNLGNAERLTMQCRVAVKNQRAIELHWDTAENAYAPNLPCK